MLQVYLSLFFFSAATGLPQAPDTAPAQQRQDQKPAAERQAPDSQPSQQPAAKPAPKPKKVITNDDLTSGRVGAFSTADFSEVNDCDRICFEQVRQLARVSPASDPNWKRDVLQAIDTVRKDDEWQKHLRDLYAVHLKFCEYGAEKREELAKNADPRNVTPKEIAIDEKYDAKFKQAQAELQKLYEQQGAIQRKFAGDPFAFQFSFVQTSRIQNASCEQRWYPSNTTDDTESESESRDEDNQ